MESRYLFGKRNDFGYLENIYYEFPKSTMIKYNRICPTCGSDIFHTTKKNRNRAEKRNQNCNSCAQKVCQSGEKNGMFGKHHSKETKSIIKEKRKLQLYSDETRDKMRIISTNRIHDNKWHPSYNIIACEIIENYGKQHGYNFQHAMNGGEHFIKELGYWVDGYDKEKNVVIEYYENAHKYFINKDNLRIKKIKEALNCEIVILNE
jgi:ribosomal protein S27AE